MPKKPVKKIKSKPKSKPRPMPGLIRNEGKVTTEINRELEAALSELKLPEKRTGVRLPVRGYDAGANFWMWFGVVLLGSIVVGITVWSLNFRFVGLDWSKNPENNLLEETRQSWDEAFKDGGPSAAANQAAGEIKEKLNTIFTAPSSTGQISTDDTTATSTIKSATGTRAN